MTRTNSEDAVIEQPAIAMSSYETCKCVHETIGPANTRTDKTVVKVVE